MVILLTDCKWITLFVIVVVMKKPMGEYGHYLNVFVKPNEQRPSLLGLCHGEKMSDEIQPFHLFVYLLSYICHITLSYSLSANRKEDNVDNYSVLTL